MKKSVVILIAIIYVSAIVLVSYLGLREQSFNDITYPESLVIDNQYEIINGEKYITATMNDDGTGSLQLMCRILPEDANNTKIIYAFDDPKYANYITISEDGLITIANSALLDLLEMGYQVDFTINITSQQTSSITDSVKVRFKK